MFIVVQEVALKKNNPYGAHKRIETDQMTFTSMNGEVKTHNYYSYSTERFERSIRKAYKISIHSSHRKNGKVKKKQKVITTINYYELLEFSIYDFVYDSKMEAIAKDFNISLEELYTRIEEKLNPLSESILEEFKQTEEYRVKQEHERITTLYAAKKAQFANDYGVDGSEYDYCYNVFGELTSEDYLNKIKEQYKQKGSYYENYYNNYNKGSYSKNLYDNYNSSSYFNLKQNNYTEEEKKKLNSFYKVLAKKFHPDLNPDNDTTVEMQLLNKLKEEWNL